MPVRPRSSLAPRRVLAGARLLILAALTLLCNCTSVVPLHQGLVMRDVSFPLRDMRYPSGLRVLAEQDSRSPLVGLFLVVGAGSTSDPPGKEGLAHYIEHLAFRSRPFGKHTFRRMLERAGAGTWNAFTGLDDTVYFELGPASALPELLRLEGTRMLAPVAQITPEALATELNVVRNELRQRNETGFAGEVIGALQAAIFPAGHPYARPVIGTHESLSTLGPDDVVGFLKQHYQPANMTLLILGDVNLQSIDRLVQESLPPALLAAPSPVHPPPRMPAAAPEPPPPPAAPLVRKEGAVATPELWIGWSLPRSFDKEAYLIDFLDRGANSILASAIRTDEDIASVVTSVMPGVQGSMFLCRVQLSRGVNPERSMEHVLNQLYRLWAPANVVQGRQMNEETLQGLQRSAVVGMVLDAEDLLERGVKRSTLTHFSQDPALYARALRDVMALERTAFIDFAGRYLNRERARAVLFTPPTTGGALPDSDAVAAPATDEEDTRPIRADAERLRAVTPGVGVNAYRQLVLPNGLTAIIGRRAGLPLASVGLLLRGGTNLVPDPVAARAASLLAEPLETWHGRPVEIGARMGEQQNNDRTVYAIEGAAGNVGLMIAMLAERARSMQIASGHTWRGFQNYTVPFLRLAEQKPEAVADRAFMSALFDRHPYGRIVTGKDLVDVNESAATAWLDTTHVPRNAVLAVVGEFDPALVEQMVREQLEGWKDKGAAVAAPAPPAPSGQGAAAPRFVVTHRPGATQSQIRFGCILPPAKKSAMDTRHDVSAQILQDRLFAELRQQLGVTYGFSARAFVMSGGAAYLSVDGAVETGKLGATLTALRGTLKALTETQVTENELGWAKLRQAHRDGTAHMTNSAIVNGLIVGWNNGHGFDRIDRYAQELAEVTAASIQEDMKGCDAGNATLSIVADQDAARAAQREAWP